MTSSFGLISDIFDWSKSWFKCVFSLDMFLVIVEASVVSGTALTAVLFLAVKNDFLMVDF